MGTSQAKGHLVDLSPPCAMSQSLAFQAVGTGSYTATLGSKTATYKGQLRLRLQKTARPGYTGAFGTHGYSPTCENPPGTPFDATATTSGTTSSVSLSCTYTGTVSRVNPKVGNGTDGATAVLRGTCTVKEGKLDVSDVPTKELRTMRYVLNSCTGGPAPNFACRELTTFTATKA
jgi:hypothetical protein